MRIRVVSSKEEIESLSKGEKIIHLAFRPSNKDIFGLVKSCPEVKAIHIPGSYMKTVSDSTKMFLEIQGMLYERTALSKKSEKLIQQELATLREEDRMTPDPVELLQLETSGIRVAEYLTELPPRPLLEAKLHEAVRLAREQIAAREVPRLEGAK